MSSQTKPLSRAVRLLAAGAALSLASGCFYPDLGDGGFIFGIQPTDPVEYALSPDSAHVLLGDTTHFYTWSCTTGFCFDLSGDGNVPSEWTIQGDAVAVVRSNGSTVTTASRTSRIVIKALALGSSNITSVASDNAAFTRTVRVTVADSSVISAIEVLTVFPMYDTVRVGIPIDMFAKLSDANDNVYTAQPAAWSVSDSTVLRVGPATTALGIRARRMTGVKAGSADVVATFRGVEGRRRITIIP
jgi:hypothetical protein